MRKMKLWRLAFAMLAVFSLASCSSDDDDKVSKEEQQRWLTEMSDNYEGLLNVSVGDEERTAVEGFSVSSKDVLALSIPLEEIAKQIKDEAIATRVREIGYADVTATYKFIQTDEGAAHFMLYPSMVADQQITQPLTRTSPVTYQGLTLLFSQNYGGTYFYDMLYYGKEKGEKTHAGMTFNICVDNVLIDGERSEGFKPVKFSFMGGVKSDAQLQDQYGRLLVGTWHIESIKELKRFYEQLTFYDDGTLKGIRKWQTRALVVNDDEAHYTNWENIESGTFTGTWKLSWERETDGIPSAKKLVLHADFEEQQNSPSSVAYNLSTTFINADATTLILGDGMVHNGEDGETIYTRGEAEPSFE